MKFSLEEIALHVDGTVLGDSSIQISEVAEIQNARVGSITFLSNQMYNKYLNTTEASAIFVSDEKLVQNRDCILVDNPQLAIAKTLAMFFPEEVSEKITAAKASVVTMPGAFAKGTTNLLLDWVLLKGYEGEEHLQKFIARNLNSD